MGQLKLCIHCKAYRPCVDGGLCKSSQLPIDPVNGKVEWMGAWRARHYEFHCGREGKWFEANRASTTQDNGETTGFWKALWNKLK